MMPRAWPNGEFWALWLRIAVCILAALLFLLPFKPAHAASHRQGWHHAQPLSGHSRHVWAARGHRRSIHRASRRSFSAGSYPIVSGRNDSISIALRYLGRGNPTGTRGPWCGDFINLVEHLAGRPGIRSRMARDWARYGHAAGAVPGAIAVQSGHVAIVMRRVGARVQIVSGNWSRRVGIGWISARSVIAYRHG